MSKNMRCLCLTCKTSTVCAVTGITHLFKYNVCRAEAVQLETRLSMLGNGTLHRSELESWQGAIACTVYFCINFQKSASDSCCCGAADSACTDCLSEMPTGLTSAFVLLEGLLVDAGTLSGCCTGSILEELAANSSIVTSCLCPYTVSTIADPSIAVSATLAKDILAWSCTAASPA